MEGVPIEEIQNLCDVHAAVFKGTVEEIHMESDPTKIPGHPMYVLFQENRVIENIIDKEITPYLSNLEQPENWKALSEGFAHLQQIDKHYLRKENLIFPYMEKYGITAPPKVMWGVDDEIRLQIKAVCTLLTRSLEDACEIKKKAEETVSRVKEMVFKEDHILIPMLVEKLTQEEWLEIAAESDEFGYLLDSVPTWKPRQTKEEKQPVKPGQENGIVTLPSGHFTIEELTAMFNTLPFDLTFVGKEDEVKFFSEGKERIFPRTRTIIGRNVSNCHPPTSVHIVEKIVEDFKAGKKENEDFWIQKGDLFILIRYFAVRNEQGEYLGVLEVTQNVKPIRELQGEKRLVSD